MELLNITYRIIIPRTVFFNFNPNINYLINTCWQNRPATFNLKYDAIINLQQQAKFLFKLFQQVGEILSVFTVKINF